MKLVEVGTQQAVIRDFLDFPTALYREHPHWIRPLDKDIEEVFRPDTNKFFRHGEATRWVLYNAQNQPIGRIAAFIDRKLAPKNPQPTGGTGFFECINDTQAAHTLFRAAQDWLQVRGMEAMDGPINFGERDRFWGLHIEGDYPPNYRMFYHPPYYRELFESYGWRIYFRQITYARPVMKPIGEQWHDKAQRLASDPNYHFRYVEKGQLDRYIEDFRLIYNKAWAKHSGVREMPPAQAKAIFGQMKAIMDPRIVWFAYYQDQPIAFFLMLPDVNQIFRHLDGKFDLWAKLKFLWYRYTQGFDKMVGMAFGVVPEYQGRGVESAMVIACAKLVQSGQLPYTDFEMNWIGDFNPKMMHVATSIGGEPRKVHATYRYLFDPHAVWTDCPVIGG